MSRSMRKRKQSVFVPIQIDSPSYYSNSCKLATHLHNVSNCFHFSHQSTTHVTRYPKPIQSVAIFHWLGPWCSVDKMCNEHAILIHRWSTQSNEWIFKWDHHQYATILIYSFQLRIIIRQCILLARKMLTANGILFGFPNTHTCIFN